MENVNVEQALHIVIKNDQLAQMITLLWRGLVKRKTEFHSLCSQNFCQHIQLSLCRRVVEFLLRTFKLHWDVDRGNFPYSNFTRERERKTERIVASYSPLFLSLLLYSTRASKHLNPFIFISFSFLFFCAVGKKGGQSLMRNPFPHHEESVYTEHHQKGGKKETCDSKA